MGKGLDVYARVADVARHPTDLKPRGVVVEERGREAEGVVVGSKGTRQSRRGFDVSVDSYVTPIRVGWAYIVAVHRASKLARVRPIAVAGQRDSRLGGGCIRGCERGQH